MNMHLLNIDGVQWLRGWVLYDGGSPAFCRLAAQLENALTRRGFDLAPLQTPWVCECLDLPEGDCTEKIYVLTVQGKCFAGIPALLYIARHIWWAWPLIATTRVPGLRRIVSRLYGNRESYHKMTGWTLRSP